MDVPAIAVILLIPIFWLCRMSVGDHFMMIGRGKTNDFQPEAGLFEMMVAAKCNPYEELYIAPIVDKHVDAARKRLRNRAAVGRIIMEAEAIVKRAINDRPYAYQFHYMMGYLNALKFDVLHPKFGQVAVNYFDEAIRLDPHFKKSREIRGKLKRRMDAK